MGTAAREARLRSGVKTRDVAYAVRRDIETIQRFERGANWPRSFDEFLEGYAEAIGTTARELWAAAFDDYMGNGNGSTS